MSWQRSLPTVAAPRSSAAVSVASPVPRAIVLETLSQELTARELRKLAQRQRQAQQAEEQQESTKRLRRRKTDMRLWRGQSKAATPTDGAARVVELPSSTEQTGNAASKPRTLVRTRSAVSPSSRKQLRAKEEASHEERALEAEAQRKQAEEVYAKWLAQKRARLREAAAAKRAQEEQQRLEAQEAQRRREMARERMAAWLKAKDAQLRTKREAETAAQAEAERDKAEWLLLPLCVASSPVRSGRRGEVLACQSATVATGTVPPVPRHAAMGRQNLVTNGRLPAPPLRNRLRCGDMRHGRTLRRAKRCARPWRTAHQEGQVSSGLPPPRCCRPHSKRSCCHLGRPSIKSTA